MLKLFLHGAVPFGFRAPMDDEDAGYGDREHVDAGEERSRHLARAGTFPLPDVILSNTPPPSPLRRARSCHAFFPEKTQIQPPSPLTPPATPGAAFDGDAGVEAAQASLSHIQEVRRRLLGSFSVSPRNLPQLSWPLPRPPNPPSARGATKEEVSAAPEMRRNLRQELDGEVLGEEQQRWRLVGGELRMVADQFQLNRSKASGKASSEVAAHSAAPAILGRCLAASLICLVWWRLYNKLR
ncbi:uncharacterized protein LOC127004679 isoform X2 [Eriocheir sinensis]|uniref:uncharacterized protein LOC127004679 isoform X2 n=1 Tax=Eriocheir sinensis TaxID=95602 RepID=UPI0021C885C5|nr:uncharacterized protein LOC127004679 isoform X2 [Eriocheir sinensis]